MRTLLSDRRRILGLFLCLPILLSVNCSPSAEELRERQLLHDRFVDVIPVNVSEVVASKEEQQMRQGNERKRLILEKLLRPDAPPVKSVCKEYGVDQSMVYRWLREAKSGSMTGRTRRQNITLLEKQRLLLEAGAIAEADLGRWLREHGLHSSALDEWRSEIEKALKTAQKPVKDQSAQEIKALKKELHRKEKALAEVSALLVLKKKLATLLDEESEP